MLYSCMYVRVFDAYAYDGCYAVPVFDVMTKYMRSECVCMNSRSTYTFYINIYIDNEALGIQSAIMTSVRMINAMYAMLSYWPTACWFVSAPHDVYVPSQCINNKWFSLCLFIKWNTVEYIGSEYV